MLTLKNISLSRGTKTLLSHADLNFYEKQKAGLIGHNGCGKSTLFDLLLNKITPDTGDYLINPKLSIAHLSQQIPDSEASAIDFVLSGDAEYSDIMSRLKRAEAQKDDLAVLSCHEQLTQTGGYSKPAHAASILDGLGFSVAEQTQPVNSFSGGWRMRLSLARCLMSPAELLLLDEPTNHLDMEAIFWLERYLKQSPAAIIIISHDRDFLDAFVTHIIHIEHQTLNTYTGNYSAFELAHAQKLELQQKQHEKQQAKIAHLMTYVNRFKAKADKAKQAQSRLKAIEKMELIAAAQVDSPFSFEFFPAAKAGNPLLQCQQVSAGYESLNPILKKIQLTLAPGDRIALLGPNGEGKSTLIKTLTGKLAPLDGTIYRSPKLDIGYYAQHQLEELDPQLSPVETIQKLSPDVKEQSIRDFLGGFNFIGDMALSPIRHFSGGEKARLALAKLVWLKPNLLLLDEPTNHLDLGMRSAIELALQSYEGALILISHDRHLLKSTVDEFYLVHQSRVMPFKGDLEDYHEWLQNRSASTERSSAEPGTISYKEKKTLQNRLKKLEQLIEEHQVSIHQLDAALADPSLYEEGAKHKLEQAQNKREQVEEALLAYEEEWFEISTQMEGMVP